MATISKKSDTTGLKVLELPYVVQSMLFKKMAPIELINLSYTSSRMLNIIKLHNLKTKFSIKHSCTETDVEIRFAAQKINHKIIVSERFGHVENPDYCLKMNRLVSRVCNETDDITHITMRIDRFLKHLAMIFPSAVFDMMDIRMLQKSGGDMCFHLATGLKNFRQLHIFKLSISVINEEVGSLKSLYPVFEKSGFDMVHINGVLSDFPMTPLRNVKWLFLNQRQKWFAEKNVEWSYDGYMFAGPRTQIDDLRNMYERLQKQQVMFNKRIHMHASTILHEKIE